MRKLIKAGRQTPLVKLAAIKLTRGLPQKDHYGEMRVLNDFVRDQIRYVRDPHEVEALHTARQILSQKAGDCDDKAILLASLLESIGFETRLKAIGFAKDKFVHVLVEARIAPGNPWIPLETTEPVQAGNEVSGYVSEMFA